MVLLQTSNLSFQNIALTLQDALILHRWHPLRRWLPALTRHRICRREETKTPTCANWNAPRRRAAASAEACSSPRSTPPALGVCPLCPLSAGSASRISRLCAGGVPPPCSGLLGVTWHGGGQQ